MEFKEFYQKYNFYPRPHMEGDTVDGDHVLLSWISTHALTWRATLHPSGINEVIAGDFYPRPHMEGDLCNRLYPSNRQDFYPRPHMEGDCSMFFAHLLYDTFLPTPSHGGRLSAEWRG